MEHIGYELKDGIAVITLSRGKANAFNLAMVREMSSAFQQASQEAAAVVWTSGQPRFFSAGFDVTEVFDYDRTRLGEFLAAYSDLVGSILRCPKPTVAALPGQTYAGGAILALACDFRVMAEGPYGFALSEINIGVNVPEHVFWLLADAVGINRAKQMFLSGSPISAADAMTAGLVYELASEEQVLKRSIELARELAAKPSQTYAAIKEMILGFRPPWSKPVTDVDVWFTPQALEFKRLTRERLARR
jgi:enoyl-CoA hydratase/carnithine racemase